MTDLERARAIVRPWIEPLGLDDVQQAMLTEEIFAGLVAARIGEREHWLHCASVDATMEGPKLKGWNRSALDRRWREVHAEKGEDR